MPNFSCNNLNLCNPLIYHSVKLIHTKQSANFFSHEVVLKPNFFTTRRISFPNIYSKSTFQDKINSQARYECLHLLILNCRWLWLGLYHQWKRALKPWTWLVTTKFATKIKLDWLPYTFLRDNGQFRTVVYCLTVCCIVVTRCPLHAPFRSDKQYL